VGNNSTIGGFICNEAVIGDHCVVQGSLIHKRTKGGREGAPKVENGCFVGTHAMLIGDITVREETFIAAGAIVTKDTESGFLYVGAPARKTKITKWF
jgi:serine acetyltransferase